MPLIRNTVGNNMSNQPDDVLNVKDGLVKTGFLKTENQPHGYITKEMDDAVRKFQQLHGLKVDGILHPGGETEEALNTAHARKLAILGLGRASFNVENNPKANATAPWYMSRYFSDVHTYEKKIKKQAQAAKVDPDLIKSIVYLETTQGYYDRLAMFGTNKTIRPMNINVDAWKDLGYTRKDLEDSRLNIKAGIDLVKRIQKNMPKASVAEIGSVYNSLGAQNVSDYGMRLQSIYNTKPWQEGHEKR